VVRVRFSPNGQRLAAGGTTTIQERIGPEIKVWEAGTGRELGSFRERQWGSADLTFSPDSKRLATVTEWRSFLDFWDSATGRSDSTYDVGFGGGNFSVAYAPDGRSLALGCRDGSVLLWDLAAAAVTHTLRGHTATVRSLAFSPDGGFLASAGSDGSVKLWDPASGREIANYRGHSGPVWRVCFSSDSKRIASLGTDGTVKLWQIMEGPDVLTLGGNEGWAFRVAFTPDGKRLLTGSFNHVQIRDVETAKTLRTLRLGTGGVQGLALSPDGRQVAASGEFAKTFDLWDVGTGRRLVTFRGHTDFIRALAFAPDGRQVASAGEDRTVRVWDREKGKEILTLHGHTATVIGVAFSPDGLALASMSWDDTVRLWDRATGQELHSFPAAGKRWPTAFGNALAFSPDGRRLATISKQNQVVVWDVETRREALRLTGHTAEVNGVAFSSDGRRLISGASDNALKVWDAVTGEEIFTLRGHNDGVLGVAISPDGSRIASTSRDMTVKLWEAVAPRAEMVRQRHAIVNAERAPRLNNVSWEMVRVPNRSKEEYERALRQAEEACRLEPNVGYYLNTLGVAQYRAGRYADAVVTLVRSERLNSTPKRGPFPADLAFLAMAHHRLGHAAEAAACLDRLRKVMKTGGWQSDPEAKGFLREVESLIATPAPN
jgi:WD40 repeat protein